MGRLELTEQIDRSPDVVFRFIATDHVKNHPRWDPEMHLEQITTGPVGVGTRIRRRRERGDMTIEGEMEIVEFDPNRAMTGVVRDGPMEMRGGFLFEPTGEGSTRLTVIVEGDESVPLDAMREPVARSLQRMKELIESE